MGRQFAHLDDDRLIALANDLLTEGDRHDALSHLRRCEACELHFKEFVRLREEKLAGPQPTVTAHGIDLEASGAPTPMVSRRAGHRRSRTRVAATVAVLAATVLVAMVVGRGRIAPSDPLEYWLPVDEESFVLRSDDNAGELDGLWKALDAYDHRRVADAIPLLEHAQLPTADDTWTALRNLYLASCYLHAGRDADAGRLLAGTNVPTLPSPWWERAMWMTYIVDRRMGRDADAAKTLEQLSAIEGDIGERAQAARRKANS